MLTIILDTGPLGILTNPKKPHGTVDALRWAAAHIRAGNRIMVPSIADYEVRRELVRLGKACGLVSLDTWNATPSDRYIILTDNALRLASELWARARNAGTATADPKELDCDVLIADQALDYAKMHGLAPNEIIVATVNVGHLAQFVQAEIWQNISLQLLAEGNNVRDDREAWLADRIAEHARRTAEIVRLETALNERVYRLFALTPEEIAIVEESTKYRYGEV